MCCAWLTRMSKLSRFVYIPSHVTLHVKSNAEKVNSSGPKAQVPCVSALLINSSLAVRGTNVNLPFCLLLCKLPVYLFSQIGRLSAQKFGMSNELIRVKLFQRKQDNIADGLSLGPSSERSVWFIWREEELYHYGKHLR